VNLTLQYADSTAKDMRAATDLCTPPLISNAFDIQRHPCTRRTVRLLPDVPHRDWLSAAAAL